VYFLVQYDGVQWRWSLYGPGDDVFATSPPYDSQTDAHEAIRQVKNAAGGACTRLRKAPTRAGRWYWHLKSRNGKVLVRGQGYAQEADVDRVITLVALVDARTPTRTAAPVGVQAAPTVSRHVRDVDRAWEVAAGRAAARTASRLRIKVG